MVLRGVCPLGCAIAAAFGGGCGRLWFEPGAGNDATSGNGSADAIALGPFGSEMVVVELDSVTFDDDPYVRADHLEIFFTSTRTGSQGGHDIWVATRSRSSDPWTSITNVAELNSADEESDPYLTRDGLTIYFASGRVGGDVDVYMSTRPSLGAAWASPVPVTEVNTGNTDDSAVLSSDGLEMFLCRRVPDREIFRTSRPTTASPWSTPVLATTLSSGFDDCSRSLSGDDRAIYFHSSRPGGAGSHDLYVARRSTPGDSFGPAERLAELATNTGEQSPAISLDERELWFNRNAVIYRATR